MERLSHAISGPFASGEVGSFAPGEHEMWHSEYWLSLSAAAGQILAKSWDELSGGLAVVFLAI